MRRGKTKAAPSAITIGRRRERGYAGRVILFGVAARINARDIVEHVSRGHLVISEILNHSRLDDVDLLLRLFVDDAGDEGLELDGVLLVLEELELERAAEPIVRVPLELLAVDGQGADVVHDLAAEVVLAV